MASSGRRRPQPRLRPQDQPVRGRRPVPHPRGAAQRQIGNGDIIALTGSVCLADVISEQPDTLLVLLPLCNSIHLKRSDVQQSG